MKTMKTVCIYSYGGPEVLVYRDAPRPHPGAGEVLVRVHAAGINPVDWKIREGHLKEMLHHTFPLVLGWDLSGVIEGIGPGLTRLKAGDEVFSRPDISRDGAYAEFIVIKETEVALKPKSIDHIHAAALPLAGLTAWQTLFDAAALSSGQRVLIHAAAGGVGHIAVQLAKWKGAHVIGTAAAKNHDFLRKLGVDQAVDYDTERFEEAVQPVDVVLDTMGGEVQTRSWKVVKRGGILVSIASPPSVEIAARQGVRQAFVFTHPNAAQLAEIAKLADADKVKAVVETILPLSDATRGQELSERGHQRGKIVLRVAGARGPSDGILDETHNLCSIT
jgi:NADPH:quinone reductase-like Zn-dependent oxidoreductase